MDFWFILRIIFLIFLIILGSFFFILFVILRIIRRYHKFPIPGFMTRLIDNPIRRKFIQKPETVAERMHLKPGMIIIEIGPGKGSYTKALAKSILPDGKVYAIDIQQSIINRLKKRIEKEGITNIILKIDDAYNLSFEDESVDRVLMIASLPEIPDPIRVLKELKRVLKPDGMISLSEMLPDPDYPRRKTEKKWAEEAGFDLDEQFGNWFVYQLNFVKKELI
ncbi:MAG: dimethylmenaquinone methyltransferase [Promethearchaeota archaeon Loki_b32]|nr:MAG: dimethylmenaquinone methyltransferase [Candidatus Lokiarchaeota archaeon Loki_b32]